MMFRFHPRAEAELEAAVEYYEAKRVGLGIRFSEIVYEAIADACRFPDLSPIVRGVSRRYALRIFPYNVIYLVGSNELLIVAIMHQKRKPNYWASRLK